ncbi:MAG: HNH endonuclease [Candidatus Delongbacteria bacterium]|nr:HNH endonuclease [Candidatus Delongbacteria bacterium]
MTEVFSHILSLKRGTTKYGPAPHKPVLLLAVIKGFEEGDIYTPKIEITDELIQSFYNTWYALVKNDLRPRFYYPFFHLQKAKGHFWQLVPYPGKKIPKNRNHSINSFRELNDNIWHTRLSDELYKILMYPVQREKLKQAMLETYFGIKSSHIPASDYTQEVASQMLYDPEVNYARKVKRQIEEQHTDAREEYVVLRSSVFRKAIIRIYDYQCAVTGLRVRDRHNRPLLEACHIVPFAESCNDSVRNGIALSPTFHRAFDKGLIGISDDYRVVLHPELRDESRDFSLARYAGKTIMLPQNRDFHPSRQRFRAHRQRFGM